MGVLSNIEVQVPLYASIKRSQQRTADSGIARSERVGLSGSEEGKRGHFICACFPLVGNPHHQRIQPSRSALGAVEGVSLSQRSNFNSRTHCMKQYVTVYLGRGSLLSVTERLNFSARGASFCDFVRPTFRYFILF